MTNIKTNIRGIQRNTPDAESDMGSAQEIINMRHRDGAWRAIGKKQKTTGSVQVSSNNKQIGWYHHPSNVDSMLLSFDSVDKKILLHNTLTGTNVVVKKRDGTDFVLPSDETFNCFGHLENVLILFGSSNMYRFLWVRGVFEYVEFGEIDWTLEKVNEEYIDKLETRNNIAFSDLDATESEMLDTITAWYIESRSSAISHGKIEGICAFRLAIELMDGTFSWYSDIKLLRATSVDHVIEDVTTAGTFTIDFANIYDCKINMSFTQPNPNIDMYMRLYRASNYTPKITFTVPEWITYYIDLGVIKSLHVCATKPIYPYVATGSSGDWYKSQINMFNHYWEMTATKTEPRPNFLGELDTFYSIYEINALKKTAPSATEVFPFKDIETRLVIPADNFTNNKTTAKYSFNYNQRLHMMQIKTTLPEQQPIDPNYSLATAVYSPTAGYDAYVDVVFSFNNEDYVSREKIDFTLYKRWLTYSPTTVSDNQVYISRELYYPNVGAKFVRVSFSKDGINFYTYKVSSKHLMIPVSALNLSKALVEANTTGSLARFEYSDKHISDITKGWLIYDNLRFLILEVPTAGVDYATDPSCEICTELDGSYTDTNRVQLSELSNPFVLPAENSYRFGDINNEVNGIEVTHEQLSETRFGEYPLYVFTVQGVFALKSGSGSIVYSSLDYLKKHKVTDHQTIMNSKGYVVFRTDEGFFALSGREFTNISSPVQGSNVIDIQSDTKFQSLLDGFNSNAHNHLSINNFLQNTDFIACHDHVKDELWLSLTSSLDASYIFSFDTKSWFKSAETFQYFVDLSPDVVGIRESFISNVYHYDFYDMHKEDDFSDLKLFVSRPISFGSDYYKRIEHFVSRIRVEQSGSTVLSTKFYLYGSIDGFEYKIIQGGEISDNSLQDQEIRRCFVDFKYLIIVIGFNHENCELVGFESEVKEKFKTKLR